MDIHTQNFSSKKIGIRLAAELLARIDELAVHSYTSRTEIIRAALLEYLGKDGTTHVGDVGPNRDRMLEETLKAFLEAEAPKEQTSD
jgi:hypothetical protein